MKGIAPIALLSLLCGGCHLHRPSRDFEGLWRVEFEGSQFCPAPARECAYVPSEARKGPLIWLKFASEFPAEARDMPSGVYAVNFTGRRSLFQGSYGHLGMYDEEVIVDHMISIRKIESLPKG